MLQEHLLLAETAIERMRDKFTKIYNLTLSDTGDSIDAKNIDGITSEQKRAETEVETQRYLLPTPYSQNTSVAKKRRNTGGCACKSICNSNCCCIRAGNGCISFCKCVDSCSNRLEKNVTS